MILSNEEDDYNDDDDDDDDDLRNFMVCLLVILILQRQLAQRDGQITNLQGLKSKDQRKCKKLEGSMVEMESSDIRSSQFGSPRQNVSLESSSSTSQAPEFK